MSKILVTGGAGFIGGNFLLLMVKKHFEDFYVCLDQLTYAGNLETLSSISNEKNFKFIHGNISNKKFVFELFKNEGFDYVINFAAETHVDRSIINPSIFLKTNVIGTEVLLEACKKFGIKRFHQVSTDEVYGQLPLEKKDLLFTEQTPLCCSSPYSASKASADLLVLAYYKTYNLPVTISRCSNNYGPFQFPEKLIPLMIKMASDNKKLPIYGSGLNIRDWLYVSDHCEAIDLIVRNGKNGEIYNIGGNNEKTNLEVVKIILDYLKKPYSLISFVSDRPGHDLRYAIDSSKIKHELGWKPKHTFETGIKETIEWYLSNQKWLKNIESGEYLEWIKVHYCSKKNRGLKSE